MSYSTFRRKRKRWPEIYWRSGTVLRVVCSTGLPVCNPAQPVDSQWFSVPAGELVVITGVDKPHRGCTTVITKEGVSGWTSSVGLEQNDWADVVEEGLPPPWVP